MTVQSTIDKLRELRLSAMAGAFEDQCRTGGLQGLSFEDRFGILVDREWESRRNNRLARLIRSAGFRYPGACMEDIEYHADRKLDRGKLFFASTFSSKMQIDFLKVAWGISPVLHFPLRHSFRCRRGAVAGIQSLLVTDM